MAALGEWMRRMRMLLRVRKFDREMEEELRLHAELREREQQERGSSAADAHREARIAMGNALALREESRAAWGWAWLENLAQDLRFASRVLRKSPGFTLVAVLTLALGIGANTAIFSIVDAVFLRPLPFPNASRVYVVGRTGNAVGGMSISPAIFSAWRQRTAGVFAHLALLQWHGDTTWTGTGEPRLVPAMGISTGFLPMLGVQPALGRDFLSEEGQVGGPNVVLLSNSFWRASFNARRDILGQSITLDNKPYTIVGVLPVNFELPFLPSVQVWFPMQIPAVSNNPSNGGLLCFGSLDPRVTQAQAEAALTPSLAQLRQEFPKMFTAKERAHLVPLRDFLNQWAGTAPLLLLGAVGFVLLIACVNVANLMLARSATRQREMAVRSVLGARRGRIARQLMTESVLLAAFGGALGVAVCYASFQFILTLVPRDIPRVGSIRIDASVLIFAAVLSVVCGIIFGLAPALGSSHVDLSGSLKEASSQSGTGRSGRLRSTLASAEVAISLVLLIGAALTLETLVRLARVQPGFDPNNLLTFRIAPSQNRYATPAARTAFFAQALSRVSALPGVQRAALIDALPLSGGSDILFTMVGDGARQDQPLDASIRVISPDYFRTLRIPLESGRVFAPADNASNAPVVVINRMMAETYFAGQKPIGRSIWIGKGMGPAVSEPAPRQIIGVVGDIRESTLSEPASPTMFIPYSQTKWDDAFYFILRTARAPLLTLPDAHAALREIDADIPLIQPETMQNVIAQSLTGQRFDATLLGIFGALALFIAAIGVYGVISYSVNQRTHEIGVRMAMGAQRRDVLRLVTAQGLRMAGIGVAAGLAAAFGLTRLMANLLYGVSATDPLTFAGVALLLIMVALAACYFPARRAVRVDPMVALRYE